MNAAVSIAERIEAFIAHQRHLGLGYRSAACVLRGLARFLEAAGYDELDAQGWHAWCASRPSLHPNSRRKAQQIVRRFCLYVRQAQPEGFVPSPQSFARAQPHIAPMILTPEHIARALAAADALPERLPSAFTPAAARLAIVLLYTSGLRRSELLRLRLDDVDANAGLLHLRQSKFHRSRFVPLSPSASGELVRYAQVRSALAQGRSDAGYLLAHPKGRRLLGYSEAGLRTLVHRLFRDAHVRRPDGRLPRCHDLRHSFAVQSLMHGYRTEGDVQAWLPKLSVYMGHVSIESTAYYLRLVPELAALASARFERQYGQLGARQHA